MVDEEPWHSEGIRKLIADNYLVYFFIDEKVFVVWVTAVIYSGMEQSAQLEQMDLRKQPLSAAESDSSMFP